MATSLTRCGCISRGYTSSGSLARSAGSASKQPGIDPRACMALNSSAISETSGRVNSPRTIAYPSRSKSAILRASVARVTLWRAEPDPGVVPQPELPPLLERPARFPDRHADADRRPVLAGAGADALVGRSGDRRRPPVHAHAA